MGCGPFSLYVIYKEDLYTSSRDINGIVDNDDTYCYLEFIILALASAYFGLFWVVLKNPPRILCLTETFNLASVGV
jgi:hypothetical protein